MRRQAGKGHLLGGKSSKRKTALSGMVTVFEGNIDLIRTELPYSKYSR
jgi:ribosomal protein L35